MSREPRLLPMLEPPTGGLARLRVKCHAAEQQVAAWPSRRLAFASALAGGAFALALLMPMDRFWGELPATHAADRLLGVRSQGDSLRTVDAGTVVQQVPSQQAGVRLYWTERLQPLTDTPVTSD
ncbi:MAG TPA: hypothetical protein VFV64_15830 [Permianibacter sp.]|nr:hypothetical protein [Permianibacter sp.]